MSTEELPGNHLPVWMKILIIVAALPVLAFPWLLSNCPPDSTDEALLWCYPFAIAAYAVLAWICWSRRPEVSWILWAMMLITHAAIVLLIFPYILLP